MAGFAERVFVSKDNNKMTKCKFPGKPSKASSKRRVNLRNTVRPEQTETTLRAEEICRGRFAVDNFFPVYTQDFEGFSASDIEDPEKSRIKPHRKSGRDLPSSSPEALADRDVFDGGGSMRKRPLLSKSRESQLAKRLLDRAKTGKSKPETKIEFQLPTRTRPSRVIKPNKWLRSDVEGPSVSPPAGRVILREARLQLGVPARSPPTRGPFSSPTCSVCGGLRDGSPPVPGAKPGLKSCEQCRKMASKVLRLGKMVRCQGRVPSACAVVECHFCWVQKCLTMLSVPASLRAKLSDLLHGFNHSFNTSPEKCPTKSKRPKDSPKVSPKVPSPERQRQLLAGPRVKHVCRSASVALGQPPATFPLLPINNEEPTPVVPKVVPQQLTPTPMPASVPIPVTALPIPPEPQELQPVVLPPPAPITVGVKRQRRPKSQVDETVDLLSIDFWENYDLDEVSQTGFSLTGSEEFRVKALCYLCGSAGLEQMIVCGCCCEPYHTFCLGIADQSVMPWDWACPRCRVCAACGHASGSQLTCVKCDNSYHTECAGGRLHHAADRPWVCWQCLRCKSCDIDDVWRFVGNMPLCKQCYVWRQKGSFCPLCGKSYDNNDYDCKMVECGVCESWVHAKCEGLSNEAYQVVTYLPQSVEYVCRNCCLVPPAPWWKAVEAEFQAGYQGVLKALSMNRNVCRMLKWSPKKITDCDCRRASNKSEYPDMNPDVEEEQKECLCFIEDDRYTSRSKPFLADLMRIKQKVQDSEYSSLAQFHEDMTAMMENAHEPELIECYHNALKAVFKWIDPSTGRVLEAYRSPSLENTPVKSSPVKVASPAAPAPSLVPSNVSAPQYVETGDAQDNRVCLLCKVAGDAAAGEAGRLLYSGYNEWIHCNCALWSSEVYEEIDGSLQNVQMAVSRSRNLKCSVCGERGASVGCCAKGCGETLHFVCARRLGCVFLQEKVMYCSNHLAEAAGRPEEDERAFEQRRLVYVELGKRRSKPVPARDVRVCIGSLKIQQLGYIVPNLSDMEETIMPAGFVCEKWFWSTVHPWNIVRYKFQVRLQEPELSTGLDLGINLTVDHGHLDVEPTLETLSYFLAHLSLPPDVMLPPRKRKRRMPEPIDEPDNQELLPPDLEEAILKELSHEILDGISVQDIFQDMSEQEREGDDDVTLRKTGPVTLRSGNRNVTAATALKWKKKPQEGKENKMVFLQVDGAVDSSSGSEAGESPARCPDTPTIPQLDGADDSDDSDYESGDHSGGNSQGPAILSEESPVNCSNCRCTYKTQMSYDRHLERCREQSYSDDDQETEEITEEQQVSPTPKPKVYVRKKPAPPPVVAPAPLPVIIQDIAPQQFQPMMMMPMPMPPVPYQFVLPQAPMIITQPSAPLFEVVSDPNTGGMYLATTPQATAPPPVIYNMETIVSNTVHMHAVHQTYTQSTTQLMHTTKQMMNMPTGYMLSPNDLICVPVSPPRPTPPAAMQWTPQIVAKPSPPAAKPKPKPRAPPQPRSRALVDFINNFTIDDGESTPVTSHKNIKVSQARVNNQPVATIATANRPVVTLSLTTQPVAHIGAKQNFSSVATTPSIVTMAARPVVTPAATQPKPVLVNQWKQSPTIVVSQANNPIQWSSQANPTVTSLPGTVNSSVTLNNQTIGIVSSVNQSIGVVNPRTNPVSRVKPISVVTAVVRPVRTAPPPMSMPSLEVSCDSHEETFSLPMLSSPHSPWKKDFSPQPQMTCKAPLRTYSQAEPVLNLPVETSTVHLPSSLVQPYNSKLSPKPFTPPHSPFTLKPNSPTHSPKIHSPLSQTSPNPWNSPNSVNSGHVHSPKTHQLSHSLLNSVPNCTVNHTSPNLNLPSPNSVQFSTISAFPPMPDVLPSSVRHSVQSPLPHKLHPSLANTSPSNTNQFNSALPSSNSIQSINSSLSPVYNSSNSTDSGFSMQHSFSKSPRHPSPMLNSPPSTNLSFSTESTLPIPNLCVNNFSTPYSNNVPNLSPKPPPSLPLKPQVPTAVNTPSPNLPTMKPNYAASCHSFVPPPPIPPPRPSTGKILSPRSVSPNGVLNKAPTSIYQPMECDGDAIVKPEKITSPLTLAPPRIPHQLSELSLPPPKEELQPVKQQPLLMYDVKTDDGFSFSSPSLSDVWKKICDSVQNVRATYNMPQPHMAPRSFEIVGVGNHSVQHLLEQLPGAGQCTKYKPRYLKQPRSLLDEELLSPPLECSTGCARSEEVKRRKGNPDPFAWLASRHRKIPKAATCPGLPVPSVGKAQIVSPPRSIQYKQLRAAPKSDLFVYRSKIHGMGLFCNREYEQGQMVVEYAGELIRSSLTDGRERNYTRRNIDCYMFRIDDHYVVDATLKANYARFINHSCEPNCYSKVVDIEETKEDVRVVKKHIIIYAQRHIAIMEELTYDYKFPFEEVKIPCRCRSRKCRKYLN